MEWIDRGGFWVCNAEQRTNQWLRARKYRITASNFGTASGHSTKFSNPERLAMIMSGEIEDKPTQEQLDNMNYGTKMEEPAREWYERTFKAKVIETGLAVPKWDLRLGASTDGEVITLGGKPANGCIEIKCPKKMYKPLLEKIERNNVGITTDDKYGHIWPSHFDQMQGTMAIVNKDWCDYVVYCPNEFTVYTERIPFDSTYWNNELYPKLKFFLETLLAPRLKKEQLRLDPPPTAKH